MSKPTQWTITVEEDPETGDLMLPFTEEILKTVGWKEGDTLTWTVKTNGSIILSKKENENEIHTDS
jgi:bifunctional DNA-binding transcriptional regulator/antitoxin component of YhaV-PrlF toxin-antitoxin module